MSDRFIFQRAVRGDQNRTVLLKYPAVKHPSPETLRQLEHERTLARDLDAGLVLHPIALTRWAERTVLVFEDFRGVPLSHLVGVPMDVGRFLRIAEKTAEALAGVHERHVIHKDIRPDNILVDVETAQVRLTELGIASLLPREYQEADPASSIEGSFPYMSPEQTGRMNRAIDHRTDLYSLGVTFYEMLTGNLPFRAFDLLEWVHCHIAGSPRPPHEIVPRIPGPVSAIVQKLLSKVAEDRYQTARGLAHDLAICLAQWDETGAILPFPLGREDVSEQFHLPQKLYGRDHESRTLLAHFERVVATGEPELVLVSGYSGIGKSSLVRELDMPVATARGSFLAGKFEETERDVPYATVVRAFVQLIRRVLTESEEKIASFRERLSEALGPNAQILVDLIPELSLVLGEQPAVAALPLTEEKSRFHMVFRRFLSTFTAEGRPLLLFLDDLQWADAESLALIQEILTHPDTKHLLLVGAYRDNEVTPAHPLSLVISAIRTAGARVSDIVLAPLTSEDVHRIVADTLQCDAARARPLSALVEEKTGNNPFFVLQFLAALHERALISFDREARAWTWDLGSIRAAPFTDNVVDLMAAKVARLSPETRATVVQAACLGCEVDMGTLAAASRMSARDLHGVLWGALHAGLMSRVGDTYRFLHDRVREAAYLLIPEDQRAATHLAIGRTLLEATRPEDVEARVFEIVHQYNLGGALLSDAEERERLARLDLVAGRRARASTAYVSASGYLAAGVRMLGPEPFRAQHALAYALHFELATCTYLRGDLPGAAELLSTLAPHAASRLEEAAIRRLEVDLYTSMDDLDEAVARGLRGLSLFGIVIPAHPTRAEVERERERVFHLLGDRAIEDLIDLPEMTDPEIAAAQDILAVLFAPALNTDPNLSILVYCSMVNQSLRHGNSDASALAYAYFGMSLGPAFGRYREGHRFGKLGYDLMERRRSTAYKAKISSIFGDNTLFWTHHLKESLPYLDTAFRAALETGDVTFACYCCNRIVVDRLLLGHPLDQVSAEAERRLSFTRRAGFDASTQVILDIQDLVDSLRGRATPDGRARDEAARDAVMDGYPWAVVTCWHYIMQLTARVFAGDFRGAVAAAERARALLWSTVAHVQEPEFWFYGALALAGHHDDADAEERPAILEALRAHEHKLGAWAEACPENFGHKHALCVAERARVEDRPLDAMRAYDDAVRAARRHGYIQNEALANELAGRFYLRRGSETSGGAYLREARNGYAEWGAHAKVAELERRHPGVFDGGHAPLAAALVPRPEQLDLMAVLRTSQAISTEIDLARLLETLMRALVQRAGAQRGLLLLARDDELRIEAEASSGPAGVVVRVAAQSPTASAVPASIVNYVRRSRETVILDDAAQPSLFSRDPYLESHGSRAILCLPIVQQAHVIGVLYLENDLVPGAFTRERLMVVELLASQAAISLQNAILYDALHRSEAQLRAVVDNTTALIYVKDLEGRHLLVNRRLAEVIGRDDAVGRTNEELFPADIAESLSRNDRNVLASMAPLEVEEPMPFADGLHTHLSVKVPLRDATGAAYGVCGISTDITQRVEAEKERERLLHEAQEALRSRDEFLDIASHELNTPLTPLRLQVQLLRRRLEDPALSAHPRLQGLPRLLDIADHSVERLEKLVGELLDVVRIGAGKLSLKLEDVDLTTLAREAVEGLQHEVTAAGLTVDLVAFEPVVGRWDRFRVEQVLVNLLTNAIKYGMGKPITVGVRRVGPRAELWVEDRGIGIPKDDQARIFERFERAVSSHSVGGLGLGLFIARQIVEAHGGTIRVRSEPGHGATFTVELPCG
ncbi:AAA family ATPase [Polyangium jinanense]|uniref:histidine kinase n=1 Tax=Polyangium jinanense TaxID=2829994 RepID=A0A9X3XFT5_9BACT|nr:AAA family ATPase [Polyangium jinanense]MDC3962774.1 AAA family ATPase [Polyangium jinanense]MDC3989507.1 AAA family ATPase [Polyangium jinanense]